MDKEIPELIQQAEQFFNEKKYKEIVALLPDNLLEQYKNATLYGWRARAHDWLGEGEFAFLCADKAINIDPSFPWPYVSRGNALLAKREYDKAIDDYTKAIALGEKYADAYYDRGIAWYYKKEYDKAIDDYTEAITIDEKYANAYFNRGLAWYEKKEYDKAIDDYNKAIVLNEKYANAYYNRALAWYDKKEYDKAIEDYTKAIDLDKKYADAYVGRGNVWLAKKGYDKAIDDYTNATALDKKDAIAYYNRGIAWYDKKEYHKAIDDYDKAIVLDKKYAFAYYNRAWSYNFVQAFDKAIDDYKNYIQLTNNPDDFYSKVAESNIKELEKKLADGWYNEISELVAKIKKLLLFEHDCVTHYTGLSAAKAMVLSKSKFRLSEGAYLNDTSEGRELFEYLDFSTIQKKENKTLAEPFAEKPFIGSFVTEEKHDDLTLWRIYGKEDKVEARGCSLTIHKDQFLSALKNYINSKNDTGAGMQTEEQFTFYKVAYVTKDGENKFIIPGDQVNGNKLTKLMKELKTKVKKFSKKQELNTKELLNGIAYLFKSVEYQYENEVRLIVQGVGFEKTIDANTSPPRVFIELVELIPVITQITFGPKVERADEWAAAFNYNMKKEITNSGVQIIISHLPFK